MWAHRAFVRDVTLENSTRPRCTTAPSFLEDKPLFYKVFFCIRESRTFTCSSCNIVIQPTIVHRVSRTYIVPIQYLGLPPSTPQCFGNNGCSSTVLVERGVFGAFRMATPRGGRGVTIGPDTSHLDFIFVLSNSQNTHFSILTLSNAFLSINNREMESESGFSFAMASLPLQ